MVETSIIEFEELFEKRENPTDKNTIEIFNNKEKMSNIKYCIPKYQREYKWSEILINTLIDDINNKSEKMFGVLHLNYNESKKRQDIIDGQQRLTTIILILLECINGCNELKMYDEIEPLINKYRFEETYENENLKGLIQRKENKYILNFDNDKIDQKNAIKRVGKCIKEKIKSKCGGKTEEGEERKENIKRNYFLKLIENIEKLSFIIVQTYDSDTTTRAEDLFLDINEKGLHLDAEDIFKAKLFSKSPKEKKDEIHDLWSTLKINYFTLNKKFDSLIVNISRQEKNIVGTLIQKHLELFDYKEKFKKREKFLKINENLKIGNKHFIEEYNMYYTELKELLLDIDKILKKGIEKKVEYKDKIKLKDNKEIKKSYLWNSSFKSQKIMILILLFENHYNNLDEESDVDKMILFLIAVEYGLIEKNEKMLKTYYYYIKEGDNIKLSKLKEKIKEGLSNSNEIKASSMWRILDVLEIKNNQIKTSPNLRYFLYSKIRGELTKEHFIVPYSLEIDIKAQSGKHIKIKNKKELKVTIGNNEIPIDELYREKLEKISLYKNYKSNLFLIDKELNNQKLKSYFFIEKMGTLFKEFEILPYSISIVFEKINNTKNYKDLFDIYESLKENPSKEKIEKFIDKYHKFVEDYFNQEEDYTEKIKEIFELEK